DWTPAAFLQSQRGGLGLELARDSATLDALRAALVELADVEVEKLAGKQLTADDFHDLLMPDPVKALLRWLHDPDHPRKGWDKTAWRVFRGTSKKQYGFDPEADGELAGAEKLGLREQKWAPVWQRFADSPPLSPRLPARLEGARPAGSFADPEA